MATGSELSQLAMLRSLELQPEAHTGLRDYCASKSIGFSSTAFDEASADFLLEIGVEFLKIPSGEITNLPYLRRLGRMSRPITLSTGMATLDEIGTALNILAEAGTSRKSITVLHLNTTITETSGTSTL